jgi:hypothetical protein
MTTPTHRDDSSLQGWGRNLGTIAPALEELGRTYTQIHDHDATASAAVQKLATQGETDLPAAKPLTAELTSLAAELKSIADEQEALNARRRRARDRAEVLPTTYRREHETDEDRLNAPRNGRAAEKRADVTSAEQDN